MLKKWIYEQQALICEITVDFISYVKKSWKGVLGFLIISSVLFLFVMYVLRIDFKDIVVDIVAGFIFIPIVYFLIKFFYTYNPEERKRLMTIEQCVEFYKNSGLDFIKYKGKEYPSIVFYKPNGRISLADIKVETCPEPYNLPDKIRSLYEPIEDKIKKRFLDEGHFNMPKARAIAFEYAADVLTVKIQPTFYYYTFITNFFADYPLFGNDITLRRVFRDEFVANIASLDKELTSNHLGFGGFVVSRDGKVLLTLRKSTTAVSSRMLGNTFNGSVDWHETKSIHKSVITELKQEVGINVQEQDVLLMGVERNVLWLGKTDMHMLVLVDKDFQELKENARKSESRKENVNFEEINLGVKIRSVEDLKLNRDEILSNLGKGFEKLQKKYTLSLSLVTGLWLLEEFIKSTPTPR